MPAPAPLRHVWVDLLPMLPGGTNGGAKPFIINLLTDLARQQPEASFSCSTSTLALADLQAQLNLPNLHLTMANRRRRWCARPSGAQVLFCPFGPATLPRRGLPVVSTFYDLQVLAYPDFFRPVERRQRLTHLHQLQRQACRIAAISQFSRSEGIRHGLDPARISAIPIQMPGPPAQPSDEPPLGLRSRRFVLYPANLWPHKNHELLFSAFAMARHQGLPNDLTLVCTGDGQGRLEQLRRLATGLQLQQQLLLPGYVNEAELESLYSHCLAVVFPSLYEGFGMPVIEAMARGVPVCCSNNTALAEVAGDAALLVDPRHPQQIAQSLLRLAGDLELRQRLSQRGRRQARLYSNPAAMAKAYWQLLADAQQTAARR